jgi:hypothetical protein
LNDPKFFRLKGTNALLFAVVVASGRRNVSSQIMKISASMLPSARPHELTYVDFMTEQVRSGCDRQHLFRLRRQTRSDCGTTCRAFGLFRMATSAYGLLRTSAAGSPRAPRPASPKSANWRAARGRGRTAAAAELNKQAAALRHDATEFVNRVKPGGDGEKALLLTLRPEARARRENAFLFVDTRT